MPVNGALWFIRDLMVMLAFSPLVYWCLRYFPLVYIGSAWLYLAGRGNFGDSKNGLASFSLFLWEHGLVLPDVTLVC